MIRQFLILFSILLVSGNFISVFGSIQNFSTDKSIYHDGDTLKISGTVNYDPVIPSVILQIITPEGTSLAGIANVLPKSDGSFSTTFRVGGPTWPDDGTYIIKVSYGGNLEKTFSYQKSSVNSKNTAPIDTSNQSFIENPKLRIPDFPSLDRSPQYYIDRYNNEPNYKSWFDSQFPDKSIYDILGFSTYVPDWIKTYAEMWATGDMPDSEFITGLDFMLEHHIIVIPNLQYSEQNYVANIPNWIRNNADWWANDLISQQEFVNSLEYLIENQIIEIE
ncbi:MAG: hypothetical protein HZB73_04835 [Nitrosarchaeum sp.]|nr:hypothetical protein [Nitrosarchaeum sp.]